MRRAPLKRTLLALLVWAIPAIGLAQGIDRPAAIAAPERATATTAGQAAEHGLITRTLAAIVEQQRKFHRKLAATLGQIRQEGAVLAAWTLIVTSFLYGVFHAAGPGHGKAVLSTYLLTHRQRIARGIGLSAAAAGVQGLTAIVLVFGLVELAGWASRDTQVAVRWAEQLSFALVAGLGGYLAYRAAVSLRRMVRRSGDGRSAHTDACEPGCGHSHHVMPAQTDAAKDLKTSMGVVLSIGLRPCSGAVLVLAVANIFGIPWAGIAAVLAMSVGTAIAVASLALLVVSARHWATMLITKDGTGLAMAGQTIALLGGATILAVGLYLLAGTFGTAHPLGL